MYQSDKQKDLAVLKNKEIFYVFSSVKGYLIIEMKTINGRKMMQKGKKSNHDSIII